MFKVAGGFTAQSESERILKISPAYDKVTGKNILAPFSGHAV